MPRRRPRTGNRSDLTVAPPQPVRAASGQQYGKRQQQEQAQRAIPLPQQQVPRLDLNAVLQSAQNAPAPAGLLAGPSDSPDEPVTAGLPFGAGPGPEALGGAPHVDELRALYQAYPNPDLLALIENV